MGNLFVVATPIGNLGDITLRALETLKSVDFILCEDTRHTQKLLNHFEIKTPTISYHQHSDEKKVREIKELLSAGKNLSLVTDAGTPGISDPGSWLVRQLTIEQFNNLTIIPIPGPSALTAALSLCGFDTSKFLFLGFPPHKGRAKFFQEIAEAKHTVAFYESSHRIKKCLTELSGVLNKHQQICVGRELTKQFESIYRGTIEEILEMNVPEKGEFVVIVNK
ncbi:MAG: 16S rRNA (cytidine(1402)-2'-O)-methyltransferase [Candidatus Magasanikbacteria bacterium]|nr:16S rRNA (cytidine(1402)-2'-O)-methyltransferase [Candidatus Magasanikbacteria bacterium]